MRFTRWSETFRPVCERMWVLLWHQIWLSSDLSQLLFSDWLSACSAIDYRNILAGSRFVFIWQKMCGGSGARGQGRRAGALSLLLAPSLSFQSKQQEEVVNHSNVLSRNSDQQGEQRTHTQHTAGVYSRHKDALISENGPMTPDPQSQPVTENTHRHYTFINIF